MRFLCLIIILLFFSFNSNACPLKGFRYVTEQAEPYNFKVKSNQAKGIAVDLLIDIAKQLNCQVESNDIEFLPWARAYKIARTKDNVIIFTMAKSKERINSFKWSVPFIEIGYSIFSKNEINLSKINRKIIVGAVRDDYAATIVRELQNSRIDIVYANSLDSLISMLLKNRVSAAAYEDISFMWALKKSRLPGSNLLLFNLKKINAHFGFSVSADQALVDLFSSKINKGSNRYRSIINKYIGKSLSF